MVVKTIATEREFLSYLGAESIEGASRRWYREKDLGWLTWEMGPGGFIVGVRVGAMIKGTDRTVSRVLLFPFTRSDWAREWDLVETLATEGTK